MSGRLIISRHKSWHVWNGDNQERVLRDERIHREKEMKIQENERKQIQKKTMECLGAEIEVSGTSATSSLSTTVVEQVESKHINLFSTYETTSFPNNDEYMKEKANAAQLKLRREGVAPLAFAAGSLELSKKRAWYETMQSSRLDGSGIEVQRRKEQNQDGSLLRTQTQLSDNFKHADDPMSGILKTQTTNVAVKIQDVAADNTSECVRYSLNNSNMGTLLTSTVELKDSCCKRRGKSHESSHGRSHKQNDNCKDKNNHRHRERKRNEVVANAALMTDLRNKRLERERCERRRSAQLLYQWHNK